MIVFFLSCILFESAKIIHPDLEDDLCFENPDCLDLDGDGFSDVAAAVTEPAEAGSFSNILLLTR